MALLLMCTKFADFGELPWQEALGTHRQHCQSLEPGGCMSAQHDQAHCARTFQLVLGLQALPGVPYPVARQYANLMGHPTSLQWQLDAVSLSFPDTFVIPAQPSEGRPDSTAPSAAPSDLCPATVMLNSLPSSATAACTPIIAGTRTLAAIVGALLQLVQGAVSQQQQQQQQSKLSQCLN